MNRNDEIKIMLTPTPEDARRQALMEKLKQLEARLQQVRNEKQSLHSKLDGIVNEKRGIERELHITRRHLDRVLHNLQEFRAKGESAKRVLIVFNRKKEGFEYSMQARRSRMKELLSLSKDVKVADIHYKRMDGILNGIAWTENKKAFQRLLEIIQSESAKIQNKIDELSNVQREEEEKIRTLGRRLREIDREIHGIRRMFMTLEREENNLIMEIEKTKIGLQLWQPVPGFMGASIRA
jgi:septal ring factor EnvC (AmiA/AmiB activator)